MKSLYFLILFYSIHSVTFAFSDNANNNLISSGSDCAENPQTTNSFNTPPVAENDTFYLLTGCGNYQISGNALANDYDPNGDEFVFYFSSFPEVGNFTIDEQGAFSLIVPEGFLGSITFEYYIKEISDNEFSALGEVIVYVQADSDCDNISDEMDLDNDNDGILDVDEGNGAIDSDNDGFADSHDIDSDNDGITDNVEWQKEGYYLLPSQTDINKNGWDDTYDTFLSGIYYIAEDTNNDGVPDFLDLDSDNDGISDFIEGYDLNNDGEPEIWPYNTDTDKDGLDDAFDVTECWLHDYNSSGSNCPLPDLNNNGIRDWREMPVIVTRLNYSGESEIYPNPSRGTFTVNILELNREEKVELFLYNMNGELVFQKTITNNQNKVELFNSPNGTYIAKMRAENFSSINQLIINQ